MRARATAMAGLFALLVIGRLEAQEGALERVAPGIVSTDRNETFPSPSPDGKVLYFSRYEDDFDCQTLMVVRRVDGEWSEPEPLPFSGRWGDRAPRLSPDGSRLFFSSDRPLPGGTHDGYECHRPDAVRPEGRRDFNLWAVDRTEEDRKGEPRPVPGVNTPAWESHAAPAAGGALYFSSTREGSRLNDLWRAEPGGEDRVVANLGAPISTDLRETDVWVAPDESSLILVVTDHPEGHGGDDLWVSHRRAGSWQPPANLGDVVNTEEYEYGPVVTADGWLWFTSHRRSGIADIWRLPVATVPALRDTALHP